MTLFSLVEVALALLGVFILFAKDEHDLSLADQSSE